MTMQSSTSESATKSPAWLSTAIFYEIYPQSFLDTNGDGIGDLEGIIQKLDYIKSLGCDAIWLNPCFVSPFRDAGYDVADYYQVAPRYGTNADIVRLFNAAHERGMKICLDLVAGHTSDQHPWFQQSSSPLPNSYSNWYVWTNSVWDSGNSMVNGYGDREGNFLPNFFYHQPALNYGYANPDPERPWQLPVTHPDVQAVRAELFKIMRFWLDLGADGFRVDMAGSLVKSDPDYVETMKLWKQVREMFDSDYPDAVLMSEWSDPEKSILGGFHVDFMLNFGNPPAYISLLRKEKGRDLSPFTKGGHSFFDKQGKGNIREFLDTYLKHFEATKNHGFITIPSGNHDSTRVAMGRTREEIEVVFAMIMTMPGVPFVYNGDEIGTRQGLGLISKEGGYDRTGSRTPMQWDGSPNAGFSNAPADRIYLPIDPGPDRPTIASQESDPASLLNAVRGLARFRREHPALFGDADFVPLFAEPGVYPFVYQRSNASECFIIAINPSSSPSRAAFPVSNKIVSIQKVLGHEAECRLVSGKCELSIPGVSYAIFQCR